MITFIVVAQPGIYEMQAAICVATLRKNQPNDEIIAILPTGHGRLHESTIRLFNHLSIKVVSVTNNLSPKYLIGNKVLGMTVQVNGIRKIMLDSDLISLTSLTLEDFDAYNVAATPIPPFTYISEDTWRSILSFYQLDFPEFFYYYNANFVTCPANSNFPDYWWATVGRLHTALHQRCFSLRPTHPYSRELDQIALGMAGLERGDITPLPPYSYPEQDWYRWYERKNRPHNSRLVNHIINYPQYFYWFDNGLLCTRPLPRLVAITSGMTYFPERQGTPMWRYPRIQEQTMIYYPEISKKITEAVMRHPYITYHPEWNNYQAYYLGQHCPGVLL